VPMAYRLSLLTLHPSSEQMPPIGSEPGSSGELDLYPQANLFQIIDALGRANRLHGRQQQGAQDGDHGDEHQQLNQCECDGVPLRERGTIAPDGFSPG